METQFTKGIQSADDPLEFIMSDESADRVGDVIVAKGWDLRDFKSNPVALWGHDHAKPIGTWENVRVQGKQLIGKLKLAAKGTSAEIDTIRALIEQRILKAVSVGFSPIEYEPMEKGYKFTKQALHECSLVAVPCHQNALQVAKSFGCTEAQLENLFTDEDPAGQNAAPIVKSAMTQTGGKLAKTKTKATQQETYPMDISEKIAAKNERLVAVKDELTELKALVESADSEELSSDQIERVDVLTEEQDAVIKSIESLQKIEENLAKKAQPVSGSFAPATGGAFPVEEKGGDLIIRSAVIDLIAHLSKASPEQVIAERYSHDDKLKAVHSTINKSAVMPADTTTAGWAAELVRNDIRGFLTDLEPVSVYAQLRAAGTGLDFGTANSVTIPRRAAGDRGVAPAFVGEGGVIPVGKMSLASQTLNRYKVGVISNFTNELLQQSTPNIETLVRQAIIDDTSYKLDMALLDAAAAVAGVRPASILNGVTGTASSGSTAADIITDLRVLLDAMQAANLGAQPVLIMNSSRVLGLSTVLNATGQFMFRDEVAQGRLLGVPLIVSTNVPAEQVIIVDAGSFAAANGTPEFAVSDQATLVQANADGTAPTMAGDGSSAPYGNSDALGTAGEVQPSSGTAVVGAADPATGASAGYTALSMYQVYSTAVRMVLPTSWALLRPGAVDQITGAQW